LIIITLGAALSLVSVFVIFDKLEESKQQEILEVYQRGYDDGAIDTVSALFKQTQDCKISTISLDNFTKDFIDLSCLQMNSEQFPP